MQKTIIMTYTKEKEEALLDVIAALTEESHVLYSQDNFYVVEAVLNPEEPLDFDELYHLMQSDFVSPFSLLVVPKQVLNAFTLDSLMTYMTRVRFNHYELETLLLRVIKEDKQAMQDVQKQLSKVLDEALIKSILALADADLNVSIAAKNLYLHRNSLLYRLDKVYEDTGINIKSFKGLVIFYTLFAK